MIITDWRRKEQS